MRTLGELLALALDAGTIWRHRFAVMGFWFCVGFAAHTAGTVGSSMLGSQHPVLATIAFVVGVIGMVLALIMMIDACALMLRTRRLAAGDEVAGLPPSVLVSPARLTVIGTTIGPFLGVYAVWGLVEEQVRDIYFVNIALHGTGGGDDWSIDLRRITFYLILAAVCFVFRQLVGLLDRAAPRMRGGRWLTLPGILLEGMWVFASFLALAAAGSRVLGWLRGREIWEVAGTNWRRLLALLPDLDLPFDLTLPRVVAAAGHWFWSSLLPGLGTAVLLPLVWLALTATVFGWRQRTARELVSGTRIETHAVRVGERLSRQRSRASWQAGHRAVDLLTADLRTKYLPVLDALRLVLRAGPRFVGAYLVLATLLTTLEAFVTPLIDVAIGPQSVAASLASEPVTVLLVDLLFTTLAVALYVAAVDRVFAEAGGLTWSSPHSAPSTPGLGRYVR